MTRTHGVFTKRQGRAHRAALRELLAPDLAVGARLPKCAYLGAVLGIDATQALRHLRRVLVEDGIRTETRREPHHGLYVTEIAP